MIWCAASAKTPGDFGSTPDSRRNYALPPTVLSKRSKVRTLYSARMAPHNRSCMAVLAESPTPAPTSSIRTTFLLSDGSHPAGYQSL